MSIEAEIKRLQKSVSVLQDKEEIRDCLARYCRAIDRFDRQLLLSVFHEDAIDEHGKFVGGPNEFAGWALDQHLNAHFSHQHCIFNHRCELDGDTAHAETYFMFAGMNREGRPLTLGGGRYVDRFEKREGHWKIAARICLRDWAMTDERPDMSDLTSFTSTRALLSDEVRKFMNEGVGPARDMSDPSYRRPLELNPERAQQYKTMTRQS